MCVKAWLKSSVRSGPLPKKELSVKLRAFLVTDNRVFNGPLSRSLCPFSRTAHSAHLLGITLLLYARFARSLGSRARSLPHGMVEIFKYMFTL